MAISIETLESFEVDPSTGITLELAYTNRKYQTSNIIKQDERKEGILSFFQKLNYNETNDSPQEASTSDMPQSTPTSVGGGTMGGY